ncbi:unnamed protein product [Cylicocyclus nassatus]|uniref:Solute carrier family 25 member 44 n=1 Tax=Cylicocyclus nassatus TaxID=53992 RepID=A0AA36GFI8_CYLNA|nr:unnamed protein product [Cylicocyclus nassatus]
MEICSPVDYHMNYHWNIYSCVFFTNESLAYNPVIATEEVMSVPVESVPRGHLELHPRIPLSPPDNDLIVPTRSQDDLIKIVEWDHMNLALFYPLSLSSTFAVRAMLYPFAVVRSRLQLQKQHAVYKNTFDAFVNISKKEGIRGLFRGFWVTIPQLSTSLIYSTVYEKFRSILNRDFGIYSVAGVSSLAGGAASFCSQSIFVPTDIIAQYMMIYYKADKFVAGSDRRVLNYVLNEKNPRLTLGLRFIRAIYKVDGPRGFYRGFFASAMVATPSCLVFWPVYYWIQDLFNWIREKTTGRPGILLFDQAVAATIGGAASSICTNPMEMLRIRLQIHRTNYMDTMTKMLKEEKHLIFTKGLTPRMLSYSIYCCIIMVGYEAVKRVCVLPEYKDKIVW